MQPVESLKLFKNLFNYILVPTCLLTFVSFFAAYWTPDLYRIYLGSGGLSTAIMAIFISGYLCRLLVLWQMRAEASPKSKSKKTRRKVKKPVSLPYTLTIGDWIIELTAIIWSAGIFMYVAYLLFKALIPLQI
jgi:hypothetical protein